MMRWVALVVWFGLLGVGMVSCGGGAECINNIQLSEYNTSGLQCSKTCDCSNLRYEGSCVAGVCVSFARAAAQRQGEVRSCKLQQKVGSCDSGRQEAQPVPLKELLWGDCIPPVPTAENTLAACSDSQDNDCDGLTDRDDPDCAVFCNAKDTESCYTGALSTLNVGECRSGKMECQADGKWGDCTNEVLPKSEICDGKDNDCNGQIDDACGCTKDTDCPNEARCEAGSCKVPPCAAPSARCGKECVDVLSNAQHCGRCNRACTGDNTCRDGECRCSNGLTECMGTCVDTTQNNNHCGVCNNACGDRKACQQSKCVCRPSFVDCGGTCADLSSDDAHCGNCGKPCDYKDSCKGGKCECNTAKYAMCHGVCTDFATDDKHCGGCDRPCDTKTESCQNKQCTCKAPLLRCSGGCVDTQSNATHCGGCGKACGVGEFCQSGACVSAFAVAAGLDQTCAITPCGALKCWGASGQGQHGYDFVSNRYAPGLAAVEVDGTQESRMRSVALGEWHICTISLDEKLRCWGLNREGQLGYGDTKARTKPEFLEIALGVGRVAKQVVVGAWHTCALLDDKSAKCWGKNDRGQLGYGDGIARQTADSKSIDVGSGRNIRWIGAGDAFNCALLDNDTVKCWGDNAFGQLGYGDKNPRNAPPQQTVNFGAGRVAKALALGPASACALLDNDAVKCWGKNDVGQLGYGDTISREAPPTEVLDFGAGRRAKAVFMGMGSSTCAILDNNAATCWGDNSQGQLGDGKSGAGNGQTKPPTTPIDLGLGRTAKALSLGISHTCAILDNDTIKCWGKNNVGQASDEMENPLLCPSKEVFLGQAMCGGVCADLYKSPHCGSCNTSCTGADVCASGRCSSPVTAVSCGVTHTCSLQSNTDLKCWGENGFAQLGYSDKIARGSPRSPVAFGGGRFAKAIATGSNHVCALLDDQTLRCWGKNDLGQLGYGDKTNRSLSETTTINLGAGRTTKAVAASGNTTCALLDNDTAKCWGQNNYGLLGYGGIADRQAPDANPINLGVGRTAKALSVGFFHTCALLDNDTVKCWGYNAVGQLGYGDTIDRNAPDANPINLGVGRTAKAIAVAGRHTCALLDNNTVKCWGDNQTGQLGYGDRTLRLAPDANAIDLGAGRTAKMIAADSNQSQTCAILDDNSLKCWKSTTPQTVDVGAGRSAKEIRLGTGAICAILDDGTLKCWGNNSFGLLGYDDQVPRTLPDLYPVRYR